MNIRYTKIQILQIFSSLIFHYQRTYCWPTRKKILILLKKRYKRIISLSCLDQHLADLNAGLYIKSYKRTGKNADGTLYNLPSNRQLTWKAIALLMSIGIKIPRWLFVWIKTGKAPAFKNRRYKNIPSRKSEPNERSDRARSPESVPDDFGVPPGDLTPQES